MLIMGILAAIAATLALTAIALRIAVRTVVRLPEGYLNGAHPPPLFDAPASAQHLMRPFERALGGVLIVVGIILSLPGIPGPGLAIALIGLLLAEIPGTHRFVRRLLRRERVRKAVNRVRGRYARPPLST